MSTDDSLHLFEAEKPMRKSRTITCPKRIYFHHIHDEQAGVRSLIGHTSFHASRVFLPLHFAFRQHKKVIDERRQRLEEKMSHVLLPALVFSLRR